MSQPPARMAPDLDQSPCGHVTTDTDGLILWANRRFCDWLGLPCDALAGRRRLQELVSIGGRIFMQTHWQPLLQMQGSVSEVKLDFITAAGQPLPMVVNAVRGERAGLAVHDVALFVARDRDHYERELLDSRHRLQRLVGELQRQEEQALDRALFAEQMVGIVSHDLRNPLSAVLLGVRTLRAQARLDERQQQVLERIGRSADRASRLTSELLDFTAARLGSGLPVVRRPLDLHALAAEVAADLAPSFEAPLAHRRHPGDGATHLDADRLAQLLGNLVANAMAYGTPGQPVTIGSQVTGHEAVLTVHNHGMPISLGQQAELFKPMVRGAVGGAERSVGLGLYIVAEIARAHGGEVSVQSGAAEGTLFTARFPAPAAAGGAAAPG